MSITMRDRVESEEGFTLIELLVVVIIIGILAAIAIPTFLSQRERGWQAELTSAVRNAALEVEADATQNGGSYPIEAAGQTLVDNFLTGQLGQTSPTLDPVSLDYIVPVGGGFEVVGTHAELGTGSVTYSSTDGGVQPYAP